MKTGELRRTFLGNVARISGGAVAAHALTLAAMPAITRLFSPEEIGVYGLYASVIALLGSVSSLRYEVAMLVPSERQEAHTLLGLSLVILVAFSAVPMLLIGIGAGSLGRIVDPALIDMSSLLLVPIGILSFGLYQILTAFAIKDQTFNALGVSRVTVAAGRIAAQLSAGWLKAGPAGLVAGEIAGQLLGSGLLLAAAMKRRIRIFHHRPTSLWAAARRYWRFPAFAAPAALVNAAGAVHLPIFLCSYLYGAEQAGHLFLAQKAMSIPMMLLGTAIGQVYMSEIAGNRRTGEEAYGLFVDLTWRLAIVGVLIGVVAALTAPTIFPFVFGDSWNDAGIYVQSLAIMYAAQFVGAPTGQTLNIYERTRTIFIWDVTRLIFSAAAFSGSWYLGLPIEQTLLVYACAQSASYVALVIVVRYVLIEARGGVTRNSRSIAGNDAADKIKAG